MNKNFGEHYGIKPNNWNFRRAAKLSQNNF